MALPFLWTDDLSVLIFVINKIWGDVPEDVKGKAKVKLADWFDEDELEEVDKFLNEKLISQDSETENKDEN